MSDPAFRRVARAGLAPLVEEVPHGPDWADLDGDVVVEASRTNRFAWVAGVAAAAAVLVLIGVTAFLGGGEDLQPPASGQRPGDDWVAVDYPAAYSSVNDLMIWADDTIILWGGQTTDVEESPAGEPGWSYNLNRDEWTPLPASPKDPAIGAAGVWTGDEVLICCGAGEQFADFTTTVAYDPETGEWRRLADAPTSGSFTEAVWTGEEMLVVASGGVAGYKPDSDSWTTYPAPPHGARLNEIAWTGEELIVWSRVVERAVHLGYALNPATGEWRELPEPPAWPAAPDIVWAEDRLVIWGGLPARNGGSERAVGSVYYPENNIWTPMSEVLPEPEPFEGNLGTQSMAWTGDRVLVSPGAFGSGVDTSTPLLLTYHPSSDSWELVDQSSLPTAVSSAEVHRAGDAIIVRSDRIYISPYGWIPEGKPVTPDSWATSTTTTTPIPPPIFKPQPEVDPDDAAMLRVAFLDGTTAKVAWPAELDLLADGIGTSGWGALNDLGSATARTILAIPEPFETVIERWGPGDLLATYPDGDGGTVEFWGFNVDDTADYLIFDFDEWTVLVYDYKRSSDGRMSEPSREIWASSLNALTTPEGFLVLHAQPPLLLAGAGDSPPTSLTFHASGGMVDLQPGTCESGATLNEDQFSITWCDGSGEMVVSVYSDDVEFRAQVREQLVIADIAQP